MMVTECWSLISTAGAFRPTKPNFLIAFCRFFGCSCCLCIVILVATKPPTPPSSKFTECCRFLLTLRAFVFLLFSRSQWGISVVSLFGCSLMKCRKFFFFRKLGVTIVLFEIEESTQLKVIPVVWEIITWESNDLILVSGKLTWFSGKLFWNSSNQFFKVMILSK